MDLKTRAMNMLTKPASEWSVVAGESTTPAELFTSYAVPLSAIPVICGFLGMTVVGLTTPILGTMRVGMMSGLSSAVVQYVLGLVGIYVAAIIIEKLAPTFASKGSTTQAMKLVVFASTPVWLAGVLHLIPALGVLSVLAALYAVYIFYLGLPPVMHTPSDKVIPYMIASAVVIIVLSVCFNYVALAMTGVRGFGY